MSNPTPSPDPQPYSMAAPPSDRARLPESTPVYTPWIWIMVVAPLAALPAQFAYRPEYRYHTVNGVRTVDPLSVFTPAYFVILGIGLLLYALLVVLSLLDRRELLARGVERPFHWAWSFLTAAVYIIGRSVIVHRVARPRGLVPIWVFIGVFVIGLVVNLVVTLATLPDMTPTYSG